MINNIELKNIATYDGTGTSLNNLKEINFIYGANGSGKTTVSNLMNNPLFRIVRGVFIIAFLTMVWLVIFSAIDTSGSEIDYEPFQGASIVFAVLSYIIIVFLFQYHKVVNLKESIKSSYNLLNLEVIA